MTAATVGTDRDARGATPANGMKKGGQLLAACLFYCTFAGCGVTPATMPAGGSEHPHDNVDYQHIDDEPKDGDSPGPSNRSIKAQPLSELEPLLWEFSILGATEEELQQLDFVWNFGPGEEVAGDTVTYLFAIPGTHTVAVRALDSAGTEVYSLLGAAPVSGAVSTSSPDSIRIFFQSQVNYGDAGLLFSGEARSAALRDGEQISFRWTFADGVVMEGDTAQHLLAGPNPYRITLTAETTGGRTAEYVRFYTLPQQFATPQDPSTDAPDEGGGETPGEVDVDTNGESPGGETPQTETPDGGDGYWQPPPPNLVRTPQWPLKTSSVLYTDAQVQQARSRCRTEPAAIRLFDQILDEAEPWLDVPDEVIRAMLPDPKVWRAFDVSAKGCPVHGASVYAHGAYPWILHDDDPFRITCPVGGESYPSNDFTAYYRSGMEDQGLLTGPHADNGRGWVGPDGEKYWFVAYACHWNWRNRWVPAVARLAEAYTLTGDPAYAQKAIVFLDRIAELYPDADYDRQSRYAEMMSAPYPGKLLNKIWETDILYQLAVAYDLVFPALTGSSPIKLPWRSAAQIRANIEANLLEEGLEAIDRRSIYGNFGSHQSAQAYATVIRQHGPTAELLESVLTRADGDLLDQGMEYALYNSVLKDGMPFEVALNYCYFWLNSFTRIDKAISYAGLGLFEHPKMKSMFDATLDFVCIGSFVPNNGDFGEINWGLSLPEYETMASAYRELGDPAFAWATVHGEGFNNDMLDEFPQLFSPSISAQIQSAAGAYQRSPASRFLDGYGMAILNNPADTVAVAAYYGPIRYHGHHNQLGIEVFGHGHRLAPDLGRPTQTNSLVASRYTWTSHTVSHNTLMVDESRQSSGGSGELLRMHAAPTVQVVDLQSQRAYGQTSTYRRTLVLVGVGESNAYIVDVFRCRGGTDHVLSLHGQEGQFSMEGVALSSPHTIGTLAGPDVDYGEIYDDPVLGQPGYSGGYASYSGSGYQHFFNWQSATPAGVATGVWQMNGSPAARLRLHVMPHAGQELIVADAYASAEARSRVLKYMLVRRSSTAAGNTFVTVWEPVSGTGRIIDGVSMRTEAALGSGAERAAVLSIQRGSAVDHVLVAPAPGQMNLLSDNLSTDATVAVVTEAGGLRTRLFAAGGSTVNGSGSIAGAAIPTTITEAIQTVDYANAAIEIPLALSAGEVADLVGSTIRIHNAEHACVYRIGSANSTGGRLRLELTGSEIFTGRIRMNSVDASSRSVATSTKLPNHADIVGMFLVTRDLDQAARIVSASGGTIGLESGTSMAAYAADLQSAGTRDAWIADFGVGDMIEIERSVHE